MRIHRVGLIAGLLLAAQLFGTGCILVPTIVKRNVLLVISQVATMPVHAQGATNTFTGVTYGDLRSEVNFSQAVRDAGIDATKLDSVVVGKIEYRVSTADATPTRAITNGNVKITVGGGPQTDLMVNFSHSAGAITPWLRANLAPAGVTQINQMLRAVLAELKGGPPANENVICQVSGTSEPATTATDFWYEIRFTILVSGKVKTNALN